MNTRILVPVLLISLLAACGRDEPAGQQEKTFGGQLGDSYKGMLDSAKQGAQDANEQMQRKDRAARERQR